jgi:putative ABC transport system substrate-binding protein
MIATRGIHRRCAFAHVLAVGLAMRTPVFAGPIKRVGVLAPSTRAREDITLAPFFAELRRLGWVESRDIEFDWAVADDHDDALPLRAAELMARRPDLVFAPPTIAAVAAKRATSTIPIVFAAVSDPVGIGLVASLAHPGGNVTGVASIAESLAPKRLELLHEALPQARRIAVLGDANDPSSSVDEAALAPAAARLGLTLVLLNASDAAQFDAARRRVADERVDAALRARIPVIGHRAATAEAGALLSYGASLDEQLRRSAQLVDKVLKGSAPADIPVEQPNVFDLVVNQRTARMLGVALPHSILLRATRVSECAGARAWIAGARSRSRLALP